MASGAVAGVENSSSRVEFREHCRKSSASGLCRSVFAVSRDQRLSEWSAGHGEEFTAFVKFPLCVSHIPHTSELVENPISLLGSFPSKLWGEAMSVEDRVLGQFSAAEFRERSEQVCGINQIRRKCQASAGQMPCR